jgi:hypothetical protein
MLRRTLPAAILAALAGLPYAPCRAQSSFVAPDGRNRFPGVTIFCPSGTGVAPCSFGGGGTGGAVSLTQGGAAVSATNRLPVADTALDALVSGGALTIGGSVGLTGTPTVNLGAGSLTIGAVTQAGTWTVGLGAGGNAIGSVSVSNLPATQAVSQSGAWTVGLGAGSSAIGTVSVSNLPATQPVSAASLPLPAGAATAAGQSAPLGPVAPGAATATSSVLLGCLANTTLPGFSAGQQGAVPCDTSGRPYVVTVPSANNVPGYLQAVTSGGATVYRAINAASSTMAANIKPSGGMVYGYDACNSGSASAYLRLFALATAPTVGASTPIFAKLLPAGTCQNAGIAVGLVFSGGIAMDVTSGSLADADTTAVATASQVNVEVYYK